MPSILADNSSILALLKGEWNLHFGNQWRVGKREMESNKEVVWFGEKTTAHCSIASPHITYCQFKLFQNLNLRLKKKLGQQSFTSNKINFFS